MQIVLKPLTLVLFICLIFPARVMGENPQLTFTRIASRTNVVDIANAGDGSGRLFLVEQPGRIFIVDDGEELETPFLDIRDRVTSNGNEQGLLSVAFAPDYKTSGHFYAWYTAGGGDTVLSRFKVSNNPDIADPGSEQQVLKVEQPFGNHNGGRLRFGPDGMLYLGLGDGGGAFDPEGAGQDGGTLLAKLIRIDVDPSQGTYAIPADNPFTNNPAIEDEIWALGLRNPWRISFDGVTGDLYIADVGQNVWEEINVQAASSPGGENYGWSVMEGSECTGGGNACDKAGLTLPVSQYSHAGGNCSVTGGEVYRGQAYPNMHGMYFFGDYCTGNVWGLMRDGNNWVTSSLADTPYRISTFGLGEDGSLYLSGIGDGIYLVSDGDVVPEGISINPGMNDAWFYPATDGQGMLVSVFDGTDVMFVAWFTYDVERPPEDAMAMLGEPGHRWLTAQGTFEGNTATLEISQTVGGVFDSSNPAPSDAEKIGTMTIKWSSCSAALVTYAIDSPPLSGEFPIQRVVPNNVPLCEAMQ